MQNTSGSRSTTIRTYSNSKSRLWNRRVIAFSLKICKKLTRRGWNDSALDLLTVLIACMPQVLIVRIYLARLASSVGDDIVALNAIHPNAVDHLHDVKAHSRRIARIYMDLEDYQQAERYLKWRQELYPESAGTWRMLGQLKRNQGYVEEAVKCFQRGAALELNPRFKIKALGEAARTLADVGRTDAELFYRQVLDLAPKYPFALYGIIECQRDIDVNHDIVKTIRKLILDQSIPITAKCHLHYALGDVYGRCGEVSSAIAHLMIANRIRSNNSANFDMQVPQTAADARCRYFTYDKVMELSRYGCQDDILICIVGMPRSGTTLTEQIIGSHSNIHALGERQDFHRLARSLPTILRSKSTYPDCCDRLTAENIKRLSRIIVDRLRRAAGPEGRVVTKLPEDYFELGLIKILFPKTRIIHCQRNPVDVCLSCFQQNFQFMPFSKDLDTLAMQYRIYRQMMKHWSGVLAPSDILNVKYEELAAAPEESIRQIFRHLDMPFEEDCLRYYDRNQKVRTASRWQIRQPIYHTSVNRSEPYREFLGSILALENESENVPQKNC